MQFVSFGFLIFLPVVVLVNFIVPRKYRYIWLLITSVVFYLSLDLRAAGVLLATIVLNYFGAIAVGKRVESGNKALPILVCLIIADLAMLFIFRSGSILGAIGISFYMLRAIGYLVDVYRGDMKPERNFAKFALFVSFFPQIISGPIDRAGNLLPQFAYPVTVDFDRLREGLLQMLWGYVLKMVLADRLAIFVGTVFDSPDQYPGTIALLATVFYTFEIYCDFAGYSHIAIGAARILGIDVKKNFDAPYLSGSVPEFWRRWHISLSSWLRDYVYIPLGGNRKGTGRKYLNILIVFAVSGIWHGSGLTFLVWGMLHGLYQVLGYLLRPVRDRVVDIFGISRSSFSHRLFKIIVTFILVNTAWVFFRADTLQTAVTVLIRSFEFTPWVFADGSIYLLGLNEKNFALLIMGLAMLVVVDIMEYRGISLIDKILNQGPWLRWLVAIAGVLLVLICGIWGPGYDAASFIYQQF
jgi:D-alanyl-lipoteichoic acid acyltransferase DltB (MBOAT superfamily)